MGDHQKDVGWGPPVIFALVAVAATVAFALWPNWQNYCPATEVLAECSRQWISALSGWAAAIAAAITIFVLFKQIAQDAKFRKEDRVSKARSVCEIVALDLIATANRLRLMSNEGDGGPSLSEVATNLIADIVPIDPVMAVMVQRHSLEVAKVDNVFEQGRPAGLPGLATYWTGISRAEMLAIAFRADVLAHSFAECSKQLKEAGQVTNISPKTTSIDEACEKYGVSRAHLTYLMALGIGPTTEN
ncbi:hypothetical protein ACHMW4_04150 [Mesorhizobium sp. UC22_110]|uniref:hypothetical protein n=1 Tax=unclassified Mesorhizobium TaxID=325217 RepID=UPI00366C1903